MSSWCSPCTVPSGIYDLLKLFYWFPLTATGLCLYPWDRMTRLGGPNRRNLCQNPSSEWYMCMIADIRQWFSVYSVLIIPKGWFNGDWESKNYPGSLRIFLRFSVRHLFKDSFYIFLIFFLSNTLQESILIWEHSWTSWRIGKNSLNSVPKFIYGYVKNLFWVVLFYHSTYKFTL